jgi:hypothetical protein
MGAIAKRSALKQRIGDRHRLPAARISNFELYCGRDLSQPCRFNWRRRLDDVSFVVIAFAGKSDIDELGAEHRNQR